MGPRKALIESQSSCPKPTVSATATTPPPPELLAVSGTRVRNQRRTTTPVRGFCDAPAHGTPVRRCRVSTTDQQPQLQVDALQHAGCYRVFTETASGARTDRPILEQVLDQLRPGDTLAVGKLGHNAGREPRFDLPPPHSFWASQSWLGAYPALGAG
jgi:hypothetical protein